ncbi:MAG: hemin-degrading factor [Rhodobacteraceae bacterium]|nr:hemin-degrading factor [Paracoccaceae bacterium]
MPDETIAATYQRVVELAGVQPELRAVDAAGALGISEAELVEAKMISGAARMLRRTEERGFSPVLEGLQGLGEVMCLTRNDHAVHERYGKFDNVDLGKGMGLVANRTINLRVMMHRWAYGFVIEEEVKSGFRISLQFFDRHGRAVHKVYPTGATDRAGFDRMVAEWVDEQPRKIVVEPPGEPETDRPDGEVDIAALRGDWEGMSDVHHFNGLLKRNAVGRMQALRLVGDDLAREIPSGATTAALEESARRGLSIMIFVGNTGCIQIHTDPVQTIRPMGPWINVLDEKFHLHLRQDRVGHVWVVRKPTDVGHVTSLEAYTDDGELIMLMFGERDEGSHEKDSWRTLVNDLSAGR